MNSSAESKPTVPILRRADRNPENSQPPAPHSSTRPQANRPARRREQPTRAPAIRPATKLSAGVAQREYPKFSLEGFPQHLHALRHRLVRVFLAFHFERDVAVVIHG